MGGIYLLVAIIASCCDSLSAADYQRDDTGFSYASYYQHHMVLQRAPSRASVWGFAAVRDIGGIVTVNISSEFMSTISITATVQPGDDTKHATWRAVFPPLAVTHPCTVTSILSDYAAIVLSDVLFGDVWVCSGQSNMKLTVSQIFNAAAVAAEAHKYSNTIRFFSVGQVQSAMPLTDLQNIEINWAIPNNKSIQLFSAVCWLFAKNIYDHRGVVMGLVESAWGGTNIEAWSSPECLHACHLDSAIPPDLLPAARLVADPVFRWETSVTMGNSLLWNAMIHPLLNMTIYGVIWYQGESNADYNRDLYNCTFPAMITDWRQKWFIATGALTDLQFPFGFVQIGPTDGKPVVAGYTDIRWHATADVGFVPNDILENVFMAVSFDLTDIE
jgi:sialate O-acetylesterase